MARKTKSEAEATRDELLCAAERVFLERGVARATLEQIAADAGVTRGALYWHFENKADLFKAMLDRVQMPLVELIERLPTEPEEGPFQALRHLCARSLRNLTTDPQYRRVYTILHHRCENVAEVEDCLRPQAEALGRVLTSIEDYLARSPNREALHVDLTPRLAARAVHVFMLGLHYDWLRDPEAFDLAADSGPLLDALFRSLAR